MKTDFENAADNVRKDLMTYLPKMIAYKSMIQKSVLLVATPAEKEDVRNSRINPSLIGKLAKLAHGVWSASPDMESLYCVAMAVGTIIKEYEWGIQYLTPEGLQSMANLIKNAEYDAE